MTDENIEIKIQDKISPSISTKLKTIAAESREADAAVKNLQLQLNALNGNNLTVILQNASQASRALGQTTIAAQKLATEQQRTATAAANAAAAQTRAAAATIEGATAQQRLEAATARANAAQAQSETVAQRLATEQQRTAAAAARTAAANDRAAISAIRLQQAQDKTARSANEMERSAEALRRSLYPLYDAQQAHNEEVQKALRLYKAGAINIKTYTDAVNRSTDRMHAATRGAKALSTGLAKTAAGAQLSRHHLTNLGFQLNDIGVSLASGQNPLTVFIQQGAQIGGIASQAGVGMGTLAKAAVLMIVPFLPLVGTIGAVVGALMLFNKEVEKTANLKEYAEDLGLTAKEMKKLEDVSITFGDTFSGLWKTLNDATGVGGFFKNLGASALKAFKNIIGYTTLAGQSIYSIFKASFAVVAELWARLPNFVKVPIAAAINELMSAFESFVNNAIRGINLIIQGLNKISSVKITNIEAVKFDQIESKVAESNGKSLANTFVDSYVSSLDSAKKSTSKFMEDWQTNTADSARERIKKQADSIIEERTPSKQSNELEKLQKALARVRGEVSPSEDAMRKLANAQDVLNKSVEAGFINQTEAERVMSRLQQKYKDALDPIGAVNRQLTEESNLLAMLPKQRELEQRMLQIKNDLQSKNIEYTEEELSQLRQRLVLTQQMNAVSQQEASLMAGSVDRRQAEIDKLTAINSLLANKSSGFTQTDALSAIGGTEAGGFLAGSPEMINAEVERLGESYAQIDALRQADLISEQSAAAAKMQIWNAQQTAQLKTAKTFFGSLEVLQSSSNKKLAAVGKAAAITNAVINTYQAATGAYASLASIPYVGPALGAAAAAAAIAAGMANVGQIRSQNTSGFMGGGYTGNIAKDEIAGVVHGREYVMDAASTARIGVNNLAALRSGAAQVTQNSANAATKTAPKADAPTQGENGSNVGNTTNVRMVTVLDPALVGDYLATPEGEQVFVNTIRRNSDVVKQAISNG